MTGTDDAVDPIAIESGKAQLAASRTIRFDRLRSVARITTQKLAGSAADGGATGGLTVANHFLA